MPIGGGGRCRPRPASTRAKKQLRSRYSLGFIDRPSRKTSPNLRVLWPPTHFSSILRIRSGTHQAPFSAIEYFRSGWRSKTPPQISTQSGGPPTSHASAA